MAKIRISALYNDAKEVSEALLFSSGDNSIIPVMKDEKGNVIDNDFISYYLANSNLFDRYIRNNYGKMIYSYYEEEDESALESWKAEIKSIALINIHHLASIYAKAMIVKTFQIGADLKTVTNLGATEVTMLHGAKHSETTYGEDVTETAYGAQSGSTTAAPRQTTTNNYNKSYELGNLDNIEKSETSTIQVIDSSQASAHTDTTTRDLRTDEHDENTYTDKNSGKAVENTTTVYNDLDYYRNLAQYPEFSAVMHTIIKELIILTGVTYEY